jgi:ABC-2 type transport system ATP-binding protein
VIVTASASTDLDRLGAAVGGAVDPERREVTVEAGETGGSATLIAAVRSLDAAGLEVDDVLLRRPTLDEVFLHLTADQTSPEGAAR